MRAPLLLALGSLALAACSASLPDVPGLGPRPIERRPVLPPDASSEPQTPVTPALADRLTTLMADAKAGHARFETERAGVAATLAKSRGASEGSEAWIAGQQALSALDAARAPVRDAAGAIDALRTDPSYAGAGDRAAIAAAEAEIAALATAEAQAADALSS